MSTKPDGYAVLTDYGAFVGIWPSKGSAEVVMNRSPSIKNERIVEMVFADKLETAQQALRRAEQRIDDLGLAIEVLKLERRFIRID